MSVAITSRAPRVAPTRLALQANEVHVWWAQLDLPAWRMMQLARALSPAELDRAWRFRSLGDRNRFVARRGTLRQICSAYLGIEAGEIAFDCGPYGKPYLTQTTGGDTLQFSTSHSHGTALYAVTLGREVGVDIERIRPDMAWQSVTTMCLSTREMAALRTLAPAEQSRAFFRLWTRKEAYIKARGTGLSTRLNQIDVLGERTRPSVATRIGGNRLDPWFGSLQDLDVGPNDAAALAVTEQGLTVVSGEWH